MSSSPSPVVYIPVMHIDESLAAEQSIIDDPNGLHSQVVVNLLKRYEDPNTLNAVSIPVGFRRVRLRENRRYTDTAKSYLLHHMHEFCGETTYRAIDTSVSDDGSVSINGDPYFLYEEICVQKYSTIILTKGLPDGFGAGTRVLVLETHPRCILGVVLSGEKSGVIIAIERLAITGESIKREQFPIRHCMLTELIKRFFRLCLSSDQLLAIVDEDRKSHEEVMNGKYRPAVVTDVCPGSDDYFKKIYLEKYKYIPHCDKYFIFESLDDSDL